jgi:hypothetical protein
MFLSILSCSNSGHGDSSSISSSIASIGCCPQRLFNNVIDSIEIVEQPGYSPTLQISEEVNNIYKLHDSLVGRFLAVLKGAKILDSIGGLGTKGEEIRERFRYIIRIYTKDSMYRYLTDGYSFVGYGHYRELGEMVYGCIDTSIFAFFRSVGPQSYSLFSLNSNYSSEDRPFDSSYAVRNRQRINQLSFGMKQHLFDIVSSSKEAKNYEDKLNSRNYWFRKSMAIIVKTPDNISPLYKVVLGVQDDDGFQPELIFYLNRSLAICQVEDVYDFISHH